MQKIQRILAFGIVCLFLMGSSALRAQSLDYRFQTVFIYNFTKYLQWNQNIGSSFKIGVIGESEITPELMKMAATRKVGDKSIVVKVYGDVGQIDDCQIIYVPKGQSGKIGEVMSKAQSQGSLVVTETPGLAQKGSNINFVKQGGKWVFELNRTTTKAVGIKVSSQLEKLAILVN